MEHLLAPLAFEGPFPLSDRPPTIAEPCRIAVHRDLTELAADWIGLEARVAGSVFQSHAWCSAWAAASRRAGCPTAARIVTVWSGGRLVLLWPLAVRRLGPFRVLHGFAHPATQSCDALVEAGPAQGRWLELAWDAIRGMGGVDAVHVTGMRDDAAIAPLVASRQPAQVTRTDAAPFADFRPSAPPMRRRSGRTRNALQRHLRHLSEHGAPVFEVIADGPSRVRAIREMLALKHAWLARTGKLSAGYAHPANDAFLAMLARRDDFLVVRLTVGGTTAAIEGGTLRDGRYASLVQSYDERFAAHGPGRLVFWHMVERAADLGIDVLDFLAPTCRHKAEWANGSMPVRDTLVPLRARGWLIAAYVRRLRPLLKRCAALLPRPTRPASGDAPPPDAGSR